MAKKRVKKRTAGAVKVGVTAMPLGDEDQQTLTLTKGQQNLANRTLRNLLSSTEKRYERLKKAGKPLPVNAKSFLRELRDAIKAIPERD